MKQLENNDTNKKPNGFFPKNGTFAFINNSHPHQTTQKMASGAGKSAAFMLLVFNLFLYFIVIAIASWALDFGIEKSHETASILSLPAHIFPIYFPFGNTATGFVVIFSILAGVVGFTTSLTGIINVVQWNPPNLHTAVNSSLVSWLLTLLAMGFACKEIDIGWPDTNLRSMEIILIFLSATQLLAVAALFAAVSEVVARHGRII